MLTYLLMLYQL